MALRKCSSKKFVKRSEDFFRLKVEDIIDRRHWDLPVIEKDDRILHLLAILCNKDHVWVVNNLEKRHVVGIVTEHDILKMITPHTKQARFRISAPSTYSFELDDSVDSIMKIHPVTCSLTDTVKDVLKNVEYYNCRRLAVVDDDGFTLIGEITVHQVITMYYKYICSKISSGEKRKSSPSKQKR